MTTATKDRDAAEKEQERSNEERDKANKARAKAAEDKEKEYFDGLKKDAGKEGKDSKIPEEHDASNPLAILAPENRTVDNGTDSIVEPTGGIKTSHPERFGPDGRPYNQIGQPEDVLNAELKRLGEIHNAEVQALNVKDQEREEVLTGRRPDVPGPDNSLPEPEKPERPSRPEPPKPEPKK